MYLNALSLSESLAISLTFKCKALRKIFFFLSSQTNIVSTQFFLTYLAIF